MSSSTPETTGPAADPIQPHATCLGCGHVLADAQINSVCPQCGRLFELTDLSSLAVPPSVAAPATAQPPVALGDTAARGVFYVLALVGSVKAINLVGQYLLSWILGGTDFGYTAIAYSVAGFFGLLAQGGVRDMLIRRWQEFDRWGTSAFWLSLVLGFSSTALNAAAAPLAAWFFHDPRLTWLIVLLGCQNIFGSLSIVPDARLNIDLRFKTVAAINFTHSFSVTTLSVLFAAMGFGPYAFILPWPISAFIRMALSWVAARPRIGLHPQVHLWRHMASDNLLLMGASFCWMITAQCDYMILARMYPDKEVVGHYFWAFNLSTQALQLLSLNVAGVLFPSLAKMQGDPQRQVRAFLRASNMLTILAVPACLLQATLADPLVRLVFKPEWYPAIPIVAILSAGWILFVGMHSAMSMLKAQGRFAAVLWFMVIEAVLFLTVVPIGARFGAASGAAVAVAIHSAIFGPASVYLAIRRGGGTWRDTAGIFASPLLAGAIAFGFAALVGYNIPLPPGRWGHGFRIAIITALAGGLYLPLIYLLARTAALDLRDRILGLIKRRPNPSAPAAAAAANAAAPTAA